MNTTIANADVFEITATPRKRSKAKLARYRKIAAAYNKPGATMESVAVGFGITPPSVRNAMLALGREGKIRPRGRHADKAPKVKREPGQTIMAAIGTEARAMYVDAGQTLNKIAKHFRTSAPTVAAALREIGVELRPRGRVPTSQAAM